MLNTPSLSLLLWIWVSQAQECGLRISSNSVWLTSWASSESSFSGKNSPQALVPGGSQSHYLLLSFLSTLKTIRGSIMCNPFFFFLVLLSILSSTFTTFWGLQYVHEICIDLSRTCALLPAVGLELLVYLPVTAILGTVHFHNCCRVFWFHTTYLLVFQSFSERKKKIKVSILARNKPVP